MCAKQTVACALAWTLFAAGRNAAFAEWEEVQVVQTWEGDIGLVGDAEQAVWQRLASKHVINDRDTLDRVWKLLRRPESEKLPEVDFQTNLVYFRFFPNSQLRYYKLVRYSRGNAGLFARQHVIFNINRIICGQYVMMIVPRKGLRTMDGVAIGKPPRKRADAHDMEQ